MRILDDCSQIATEYRWRNINIGPHWALIIRFVPLYDYACQMEAALNEIANLPSDNHNADLARRKAIEALKGGEK